MTRIWERLYIGGLADAEELTCSNPHGITTVISLTKLAVQAKRLGINYLHFPFEEDKPIPIQQFDRIIDAIAENIRWGCVMLHDNQGMSRVSLMAAAWMHAVGFKNIDAALDEIRRVCPDIWPSEIVVESVRKHLR